MKYNGIKMLIGIAIIISGILACQKEENLITSPVVDPTTTQTTEVTSIDVKTKTGNGIYAAGGTADIIVTVAPSKANQKYNLSLLSGSDFASLTNNVLTAKKNGIAILKAVTADGSLSDTCAVVIANQTQSVSTETSITVKTTNRTGIYTPGGTANIVVTITPSTVNQSYTLSIINGSEFASLSNNILTAKKNGITIIKAITADGNHSDTCAVVIANQKASAPSNARIIQDTVINSNSTAGIDIISLRPTEYVPTIIKNNIITARNSEEHIILLGGESTSASDHMLDGISITGNKIVWTGTDLSDGNEGILTGYSINATIEYNYIQNCPYGTPTKSDGFTYTSGGVAYNVYGSSFKVGTGAKGVNGVKFYNNTFYNTRNAGEGVIGSIYLNSNNDISAAPASTNCQIFNNIFYTKHQVANIYCDNASLSGLQCDYNVYYCEDGEPVFRIGGQTITLTQWRAKGYDKHSVVINPNFNNFTNLIPSSPLNNGTNLGSDWQYGLDPGTQWNGSDPILKSQGATWQVGAYIK